MHKKSGGWNTREAWKNHQNLARQGWGLVKFTKLNRLLIGLISKRGVEGGWRGWVV